MSLSLSSSLIVVVAVVAVVSDQEFEIAQRNFEIAQRNRSAKLSEDVEANGVVGGDTDSAVVGENTDRKEVEASGTLSADKA